MKLLIASDIHGSAYYCAQLLARIEESERDVIAELLSQDPRPSYQSDPERVYGMSFAEVEVRFRVAEDVLTVVDVTKK